MFQMRFCACAPVSDQCAYSYKQNIQIFHSYGIVYGDKTV